jgi:formate dehydrogenase subunit gamma
VATAEPLRRAQSAEAEGFGRTVVYRHEILRHGVYTRVVHWTVAITFILALLSGFAVFSPWLYKWLAPLFGGGATARLLHPWFGLAFVIAMVLLAHKWWNDMRWTQNDRTWLRRIREYVTNADKAEPDYVGKFNAGQKMWFWTMVVSGVIFLISGLPMWFPEYFGRTSAWISYFIHDVTGLIMLGGFFIHVYESTAAIPGVFHSMIRGTVPEAWAWTHHPAWYRAVTGRDPKADRERASRAGPSD